LEVEAIELLIRRLFRRQDEALARLPAVFVLPVPRDEDRDVIALAALGLLPRLVEVVADAVGGRLEEDLGPRHVRHRLQDAAYVLVGVRPVRDFRAVEELQRRASARSLRPRRADLVARVEEVEVQLVGVRRAGVRPHQLRAVLVIPIRHLEEVLGRLLFVGQDERPDALLVRDAPVDPPLDVGAESLLAALSGR
jgi:hypothetical protein